jgi:eukaryotic-like serine/threonine-protein kinase
MPAARHSQLRRETQQTRLARHHQRGDETKRDRPAVRFGPYLLERRLAVGGMAEVFLGRIEGPASFKKRLAIKRILPHLSNDERFIKMFIDEARLAARFDHANLVHAYELTKVDGHFCLAMEYVAGADLASVIGRAKANGGVPLPIAAYVAGGVANGLHYAHELTSPAGEPLNVVHRDISPSNIMLTKNGEVKLLDFGIAKHENRCQVTQANGLKGKLTYMSPEQLRRRPIDRRSDIFSLGVVMYELLTGESPLSGTSDFEIMRSAHDGTYRPLRDLRPDVPPRLERLLGKMMAIDAEQRFPTAAAVRTALDRLGDDVGCAEADEVVGYLRRLFNGEELDLPPLFEADAVAVTGELSDPTVHLDPGAVQRLLSSAGTDVVAGSKKGPTEELVAELRRIGSELVASAKPTVEWCRTRIAESSMLWRFAAGAAFAAAVALLWLPFGDRGKADASKLTSQITPTTSVHIASDPPGARLFVDGQPRAGRTPMIVAHLDATHEHELRLEKDGYAPVVERVMPRASAPTVMHVVLRPLGGDEDVDDDRERTEDTGPKTGVITLDTQPPTEVWLAGKLLGTTPLNARVAAGNAVLRLRNESLGIEKRLEAKVQAGRTVAKSVTFRKGLVRLDVKPWADVYMGSRKLGTTPMAPMTLYEGTYELRLHNPELGKERLIQVEVEGGKTIKRIESL